MDNSEDKISLILEKKQNPTLEKDNSCEKKKNNLISNKEKLTTDEVVYYIIKDIDFHNNIERKILEEQERTWLKFTREVPRKVKKEVPPIIKEKRGNRVRWLKDGCLVLEFFSKDELAEIRHRRSQKKPVEEKTGEMKGYPRKKRRENIPKPQTTEGSDSSKHKSKPYNKKNSNNFRSKSQK